MNLLIGDSHILCLENYNNKYNNNLYEFSATSIRGLVNKSSTSGSREIILNLLKLNKYEKLFLMFGKVDLEWVYPYKCRKENINFNEFVDDTINKYIEFINEIKINFNIIYVMGLHIPSLEEYDMLNCVNNYNAIKNVSSKAFIEDNLSLITEIGCLKTRTKQIYYFNKILENKIKDIIECKYIDINDELLDETTNTCKKIYINEGDHHLIRNITGLVWFEKHLKFKF